MSIARGQIRMKVYIPKRKYELASIYFVHCQEERINNRKYYTSGHTGLQSAFVKQTKGKKLIKAYGLEWKGRRLDILYNIFRQLFCAL